MQQSTASGDKLISLNFNVDSTEENIKTTIAIDHLERHDDKRAEYAPIVSINSVHLIGNKKCSLKIDYVAKFLFDNPKGINEGDLFGCIKYICDKIQHIIDVNYTYFGRIKLNPESVDLQSDLYDVIKKFHS